MKLESISKILRKNAIKTAAQLSLILFFVLSVFIYWFQANQIKTVIDKKLEIDSVFVVEALDIGDLFFITRYLNALVSSGTVEAVGLKQDGEWLKVRTNLKESEIRQSGHFSVDLFGTLNTDEKTLEKDGVTRGTLVYSYRLPHSFLLLSLILSIFLSAVIFFLVNRLLISSSKVFVDPVENLASDIDNQKSLDSDKLNLSRYQKGLRFRETERLVAELQNLIIQINSQKDELKKVEILEALNNLSQQVNHDIKSPLGALRSALQQIGTHPEKAIKLMNKAVDRIDGILKDLAVKDPSAITEMQKQQDVDLSEFIKNLVEEKITEFESVEAQIIFTDNTSGSRIKIDEVGLGRALSNLINNGIEASFPHRPRIHVTLVSSKDYVIIDIKDHGNGIPEKEIPKIFESGFTSGKDGNSGLGLYQVQNFVKEAKGQIRLIRSDSTGTVFCLKFPN